jgi:hypothetical protein
MRICSYAPQQHANDDFSENISSKCMLQQHSAHLKFKAYGELDLDALNLLIWHTVLHIDLLHVYATLKLNGDRTMALNRMSNGKRWPSLQKKKSSFLVNICIPLPPRSTSLCIEENGSKT